VNFAERIAKYQEFEAANNFNLINFAETILAKIPAGTKLVPIPVIPTLNDCWHGEAATKMKLTAGHVEPKADFIIKIGNLQGCFTTLVSQGTNSDSGTEMYEVLYNAGFYLPDGTPITVEGEGKAQELYNYDDRGNKKKLAHIVESTRKKARRNAIKNLNKIPTSMPQADFLRPWIILRPVFTAGVSAETDQAIARLEASKNSAAKLLYGDAPQTIDVQAEPHADSDGQLTVEGAKRLIETTKTLADLETTKVALTDVPMTTAQRKELFDMLSAKTTELTPDGGEGEVRY
jgi:hypothetical protein